MARAVRQWRDRQQGVALVVVLWVSMLLAGMASAFVMDTRTEVRTSGNMADVLGVRSLVDGGVYLAIAMLSDQGSGADLLRDGRPHEVTLPGGGVTLSVQSEYGKIDLNSAPDGLLLGLLVSVGVDPGRADRLVDAIADWRDTDSLRRLHGAEEDDYATEGLPSHPRNAPFEVVDELRQLFGMDAETYERLRPLVTTFTRRRTIDPEAAPLAVLAALPGVTPGVVHEANALRLAGDGEAVRAVLATVVSPVLLARGDGIFAIRVAAQGEGGASHLREAVVLLSPGGSPPYRILDWRQTPWPAEPGDGQR